MPTLKKFVKEFIHEPHKFFKYKDVNGIELKREFVFENYEHYLQEYLGFFKSMNSIKDVIPYACCGVFSIVRDNQKFLIRHNHQGYFQGNNGNYRGLPIEDGKIIAGIINARLMYSQSIIFNNYMI